ncbi:fumarylacetoacetate hydrolase family protein [uncultured Ruegeria sp.]|uniref:2-keto-4-pentenoate hydratase n=1 Tax=uncultured Ruegeria sp. TaxID=259304 RepID=UPI00263840BA|nr:fumarylacetoacetate hydrolase family protein [uncultured Ruegeria sp.]
MSENAEIAEAAELLRTAQETRKACAPIRDLIGETDIDAAYKVQGINHEHALASGRRQVGYKIGLTAKAVQKQLGVDQPDYGVLYADMMLGDTSDIDTSQLIAPKVEAEIAFVLGRDIAHADVTITELMDAIDHALPAIEVVDSRVKDWNIRITDTVADNAAGALCVLGTTPRKLSELDLRLCGMAMLNRGEPIATGAGLACLGNPLNATLWLVQKMTSLGQSLRAGDVIMSGALGPMAPAKSGETYEANISGLGSVRAVFAGS